MSRLGNFWSDSPGEGPHVPGDCHNQVARSLKQLVYVPSTMNCLIGLGNSSFADNLFYLRVDVGDYVST